VSAHANPEDGPRRVLSATDVIALVVGLVVGAGIFRTPGLVAEAAGSPGAALLAWLLGGVVSVLGVLCYPELAGAYPHAGGEYHYLRRAFSSSVGFLFVWSRLTVIQSGCVAMQAFIVGDYAARTLGLHPDTSAAGAAVAVVAMTAFNLAGLRLATGLQSGLAVSIVVGLLAVIACGFVVAPSQSTGTLPVTTPEAGEPGFGVAMVFVLLTYGGWNEAAYVSAEVRSGARALSRALLGGIATVTALYLAANVALFRGLGFEGVAGSATVAADVVEPVLGESGARLLSVLVVVAAVAAMNATLITGARSGYALGRDYTRLSFLGRWRRDTNTPPSAIVAQGAAALALVGIGALTRRGFDTMVELTAPVFWGFFLLVGVALLVLRHKEPERPRPFSVPGYPLVPVLFCGCAAYMLFASLAHAEVGAGLGVALLVLGVPVLWIVQRPAPRAMSPTGKGAVP
jgi:amino acid transporter